MLSRLFYLEPGQLRRLAPFFALYSVLFGALTLIDGLSLSLFVQQVGTARLPKYYAISAAAVFVVVGAYMHWAGCLRSDRLFFAILLVPLALPAIVWVGLRLLGWDSSSLGLLLIGRELAFALVLLHFGAYLQDYFTRSELLRVMPVVYSGGRVGGIAGGVALERLTAWISPLDLLLLVVALLLLGVWGIWLIYRRVPFVAEEPALFGGTGRERLLEPAAQHAAADSLTGFFRFVRHHPVMFWITTTTILYFLCRTFLAFRCSEYFEVALGSDVEMAQFLGRYTQAALLLSLVLQLLFVSRWIALVGLAGAHLTYGGLMAAAGLLGSVPMTMATAVFARLVENELRFSLRNPVAQMTLNCFPRPVRLRARAWSLGILIPLSTLAAAAAMAAMQRGAATGMIAVATGALAVGYFLAIAALARHLRGN